MATLTRPPKDFAMKAASVSGVSAKRSIGESDSTSPRYKTLDHWRGIACLMIVIYHTLLPLSDQDLPVRKTAKFGAVASSAFEKTATAPQSQSRTLKPKLRKMICDQLQIGVEMFFVISGYCITASAESIRRTGRTVREFYCRRFMRIFPAFWCALIGSVLFCFAIDVMNPDSLKRAPWPIPMPWDLSFFQWVGSVTLTGTWSGFLTGEPQLYFPIQEWTLCFEVQFYFVIGILMVLSRRRFFQAMAVITVAVATVNVLAVCFQFPIRGLVFDEHWFMFAAGVGLYWDLHCATLRQAKVFRMMACSVLVGLAILAATTTVIGQGTPFSAWRVVEAMGFAGLLWFLKKHDERIASLSFLNGFKSCGVICYSIYLTHLFPVKLLSQQFSYLGYRDDSTIVFVCIPLTLTMSIALGYVFYVLIERRFLTFRDDFACRQSDSNAMKTFDASCEKRELKQFARTAHLNRSAKDAA